MADGRGTPDEALIDSAEGEGGRLYALVQAELPALAEAARVVGSVQIRNRATLVGNICSAVPSCDAGPALLAYDAVVEVAVRSLADLLGYEHTLLALRDEAAERRHARRRPLGEDDEVGRDVVDVECHVGASCRCV